MNPLTQIKNTQKVSRQEIEQGVPESASCHARFKHSAYVYAGVQTACYWYTSPLADGTFSADSMANISVLLLLQAACPLI